MLLFLADIFLTVLYARAGTGLLAPYWNRAIWASLRGVAELFGRRRGAVLSFAGPLIVVSLIALLGARADGRRGAGHPARTRHRDPAVERRHADRLRHRAARRRQQPLDRRRRRLCPAYDRHAHPLPDELADRRVGAVAGAELPRPGLFRRCASATRWR